LARTAKLWVPLEKSIFIVLMELSYWTKTAHRAKIVSNESADWRKSQ